MSVMPVLVSWSSGKDSAWALHVLRSEPERFDVRGIFTTVTPAFDRVSIQATPRRVLRRQAEVLGLPLYEIAIPYPCSNVEYEDAMRGFLDRMRGLPEDLGGGIWRLETCFWRIFGLTGSRDWKGRGSRRSFQSGACRRMN